ncbi:MAG: KpsF/GutQ family sugar-phosphate isomerase [Candidatus Electryonea clarkiae]|nr:KpsF/GutQ family sugar-phosphate isomerase [Candidatus Electryonea clarkiae]MDP8285729.1 KpsF/GutQ family sugar-phosphate isomerase [Candidatus Electryonea clarkiae]
MTGQDQEIINRARQIFELELSAAHAVKDRLNSGFAEAVRVILDRKGKVVLIGAGKSGLIASKVNATFRSTGIVSIFLHPNDAVHGDIGVVSEGDVVILISKSGETDELLDLIPSLRHRGATLIAMVGEESSRLVRQADIWIDVGVEREACPIGLAPTSSTTVTMLMGDALAAVLMQLRGVTQDDFAKNHPGGSLGKRLLLDVSDLMHSDEDNPVAAPDTPMAEILYDLTHSALGGISVIDDEKKLLGIVTDGDVRRGIQKLGADFLESPVKDIMTENPVHAKASDKAIDALLLMEHRPSQIMVLPVVDDENHCVGLLRLHDLIRAGLKTERNNNV